MCSIIGYLGDSKASDIIVKGLRRMEYRGYDSVGISTENNGQISTRKDIGRVDQVNDLVNFNEMEGDNGIGHTRWATHGEVSRVNAHPHESGRLSIVHNGIIENYEELNERYGLSGESDIDSQTIASLLEYNMKSEFDMESALINTVNELEGEYAFIVLFDDGRMACVKHEKSLVIGVKGTQYFPSSDVLGFMDYTDDVIYVKNDTISIISDNGLKVMDFNGKSVSYETTKVSHDLITSVGEYEHYTIKEICEQYVLLGEQHNVSEVRERLKAVKNLYITGSGSSYNVAKYAKFLFAKCSDMVGSTNCIVSSEFEFELDSVKDHSTVLAISQSGESADVLHAVALAKKKGCEIISITNSPNSELARMSDIVIDMKCGREVGVAATKSFMITAKIITEIIYGAQTELWSRITKNVEEELGNSKMLLEIMTLAKTLANLESIYVIGRGIGIPLADEIALKLKELTYIHVESIYGGELKHGPLSLIDKDSFVIAVNHSSMSESMDKTIMELKSRGATVYEITDKPIEIESFQEGYRTDIEISAEYFMFVILLPMQLLAYHTAIEKNNNPDFPRNLAKSVTVK